jgi:putative redox protein
VLTTDAPKDNHGRGESFSPTDLVATGLGGCILTILGIQARTLGLDLAGMTATVEKEMSTEGVRRIARLSVRVHVPAEVSEMDRVKLERAAHTCPVHKSLHPEIEKPIVFTWG